MTPYHQRVNDENIINDNKAKFSWKFRKVENCCPDHYFDITYRRSLESSFRERISSNSYIIDIEEIFIVCLKYIFLISDLIHLLIGFLASLKDSIFE